MEPYVSSTDPVPPADSPVLDVRRRRILFRATHRGTQETDRLIGGFVAPRIAGFTEAELDALDEIMQLPDVDLADWLMGRRPIPEAVATPMLRAIEANAKGGGLTLRPGSGAGAGAS